MCGWPQGHTRKCGGGGARGTGVNLSNTADIAARDGKTVTGSSPACTHSPASLFHVQSINRRESNPGPLARYASGPGFDSQRLHLFLSCSFNISGVFGHNGMIQRSIIRPGLIGLWTKIIGVPTIGLPAVIPLRFSMIMHSHATIHTSGGL